MRFTFALSLIMSLYLQACAGGSGGGKPAGNDGGSEPVNASETREYKRAINKCYKTGGTRVVKIEGRLQCY